MTVPTVVQSLFTTCPTIPPSPHPEVPWIHTGNGVDLLSLTSGRVYWFVIATGNTPVGTDPSSLTSWSGLQFLNTSYLFDDDAQLDRNQIQVEASPRQLQVLHGLGLVPTGSGDISLEFGDGITWGIMLACQIDDVYSAGTRYAYRSYWGNNRTDGLLTHPELEIPDSDSRVLRAAAVIPSVDTGGSPPIAMGVNLGSGTADSQMGAMDLDEWSAAPWTAPETSLAMSFEWADSNYGAWITVTASISSEPHGAIQSGWYVDQIGWGTRTD